MNIHKKIHLYNKFTFSFIYQRNILSFTLSWCSFKRLMIPSVDRDKTIKHVWPLLVFLFLIQICCLYGDWRRQIKKNLLVLLWWTASAAAGDIDFCCKTGRVLLPTQNATHFQMHKHKNVYSWRNNSDFYFLFAIFFLYGFTKQEVQRG